MQNSEKMDKPGKRLSDIFENNVNGSEEIVLKLNNYILSEISNKNTIAKALSLAEEKLGHFAAIKSYINSIRDIINRNEEIDKFVLAFKNERDKYYSKILKNSLPYLEGKNRLLTISNSATIHFILSGLHQLNSALEVTISESRPVEEGKIMAEKLLDSGITVKLITEAMIPDSLENSDAAIIGADMIFGNGDALNKTGSLLLAIAAKYYNKPFYVICGQNKITSEQSFNQELHPAGEVWDFHHSRLKIRNFYFERIPQSLITAVITDL